MESAPAVPMISVKSVDKHFGDLHVLKDINL
ncbi:MAG: amino acid ABC transporter ATP-binding protein, partial [Mycobacterium sp.]